MPNRLNRDFRDAGVASIGQGVAIGAQPPRHQRVADFRHIDPRLRDRDGRADIPAIFHQPSELLRAEMAPRVDRDDFVGVEPLREGADLGRGGSVSQIGTMLRIELPGGDRQGAIE